MVVGEEKPEGKEASKMAYQRREETTLESKI